MSDLDRVCNALDGIKSDLAAIRDAIAKPREVGRERGLIPLRHCHELSVRARYVIHHQGLYHWSDLTREQLMECRFCEDSTADEILEWKLKVLEEIANDRS
jgi:hypothetical protein